MKRVIIVRDDRHQCVRAEEDEVRKKEGKLDSAGLFSFFHDHIEILQCFFFH